MTRMPLTDEEIEALRSSSDELIMAACMGSIEPRHRPLLEEGAEIACDLINGRLCKVSPLVTLTVAAALIKSQDDDPTAVHVPSDIHKRCNRMTVELITKIMFTGSKPRAGSDRPF